MEAAAFEECGDDRRQVDVAGRLGHQGLDQGPADALALEPGVHAESAELEAIGVCLEGDEADDLARLLGNPQGIRTHSGIVQAELPGDLDGGSGFPRPDFADLHARPLYHALVPPRRGRDDLDRMLYGQ